MHQKMVYSTRMKKFIGVLCSYWCCRTMLLADSLESSCVFTWAVYYGWLLLFSAP